MINSFAQQAYRSPCSVFEFIIFKPTISGVFGPKISDNSQISLFISPNNLSQTFPHTVLRVMKIRFIICSEMNCCLKSGIHEHSPNSRFHIQIFHRIVWLFPIDLAHHGEEDDFHVMRCIERFMAIMVPCRFRIF